MKFGYVILQGSSGERYSKSLDAHQSVTMPIGSWDGEMAVFSRK
jgi:hypothetical protein